MICPHCGKDSASGVRARYATIQDVRIDATGEGFRPVGEPVTYRIAEAINSGSRGPEARYAGQDGLIYRVSYYDPATCHAGVKVVTGGSRYHFHNDGWEGPKS